MKFWRRFWCDVLDHSRDMLLTVDSTFAKRNHVGAPQGFFGWSIVRLGVFVVVMALALPLTLIQCLITAIVECYCWLGSHLRKPGQLYTNRRRFWWVFYLIPTLGFTALFLTLPWFWKFITLAVLGLLSRLVWPVLDLMIRRSYGTG